MLWQVDTAGLSSLAIRCTPFRRDETRDKKRLCSHTREELFPAGQDKRVVEEIVAPRQIPSLSRRQCRRPKLDSMGSNNASLSVTEILDAERVRR